MTPQSDQTTPYVFIELCEELRPATRRSTWRTCWNRTESQFGSTGKSIEGGSSWTSEIVRGIRGCAVLVLLVSEAATRSRNCQQEIQLAWEHSRAILPLLLETGHASGVRWSTPSPVASGWRFSIVRPTSGCRPRCGLCTGLALSGTPCLEPARAVLESNFEVEKPPAARHADEICQPRRIR